MRKILSFILIIVLLGGVCLPIKAENDDSYSQEELGIIAEQTAKKTVISVIAKNSITGEMFPVIITNVITEISTSSEKGVNAFTVGYEVFVQVENDNSKASGGTTQQKSGATATMSVTFYTSNEQIRVANFSGGWVGTSDLYYFNNRLAGVSSGFWGCTTTIYPTSNTFSQNTGWGYVNYTLGDMGPWAWSGATA
ncbi:MAG: hypothetical protein VB009_00130 [Erysipelotrichaceae bacterium]|nr:hypothetical protein [Erysipelotrichaceae bacterium]